MMYWKSLENHWSGCGDTSLSSEQLFLVYYISYLSYLFCKKNPLALDLSGLWMFELLGFVDVQEKVLQQALSIAKLVWNLFLMKEGLIFLFIFSILVKTYNR